MFLMGSGTVAPPGVGYYISAFSGPTADSAGYHPPVVDASSNIYIPGYYQNTGLPARGLLMKTDASGAIVLQRQLSHATDSVFFTSLALDGSDNIYMLGYQYLAASPSYKMVLVKYSSAGALQWQRILTWASGDFDPSKQDLVVTSAGDVYACGSYQTGGSYVPVIFKYNTSGAIQWQYALNVGSNSYAYRLALDAVNSRLYVAGPCLGAPYRYIARIDLATPSANWAIGFNASGAVTSYTGLVVASNGDVVGQGFVNAGGSTNFTTFDRFSSAGVGLWTSSALSNGTNTNWLLGEYLGRDASDNFYLAGSWGDNAGAPNGRVCIIIKVDTSGNILWLRSLASPTLPTLSYGISSIQSNGLIVAAYSGGATPYLTMLKVPSDGTKTGTYSSYVYATPTGINTTTPSVPSGGGVNYSTLSPTLTASTVTDAAAALTDSAASLSRTLITIP
jgi:hypothetical protein